MVEFSESVSARMDEPPGIGRAVAVGAAIGMVLFFIGIGVTMLALGLTGPAALGIALFEAGFGGLGFGAMTGGVIYISRHEGDK